MKQTADGESLENGLFLDAREGWVAAGDVTLYDREELVGSLGRGSVEMTDIELLARTFRRFGASGLSRVAGDFGLVIWDWKERRVHAIRDHFGLRPVFYRLRNDGIELGSAVPQLLALDDDDRVVDDVMVYQYLTNTYAQSGHTFYASIKALRPAHVLEATAGACRESRYWEPSFKPFPGSYDELIDEWRRRFRAAVGSRLRSYGPPAVYLSGGIDSSSIVGAGHDAIAAGDLEGVRPLALSAAFAGFPCDESSYIGAVLRRCTSFDSFVWDGGDPNPDDFDDPDLTAPGLGQGVGRSRRHENRGMREKACRVVLTGDGGDALGFGYGALADLVLHRRFATLVRELALMGSWRRVRSLVRLEAEEFVSLGQRPNPPGWLGPDLSRFSAENDLEAAPRPRGPSRVQANTCAALTRPLSSYVVDTVVSAGARCAVQVRAPYLDIRLVEFVLGISWQHRLPRGDVRRLQKDGVAPMLPEAVRTRRGKAGFDAMLSHQVVANLERIRSLFQSRNWASHRFVRQARARSYLDFVTSQGPGVAPASQWREVWRIAVLEAWLRRVFGYSPRPCVQVS